MHISVLGAAALLLCLFNIPVQAADTAPPQWAEAASELPDLTAGQPASAPRLGEALAGQWRGTLTYRDYRSDARVMLPTSASIAGPSGALLIDFVYDDGPGKIVRSSDRWALAGDTLQMERAGAPLSVSAYRSGDGDDLTLVALGTGRDNGAEVAVRAVVLRRGDTLTISRATRLPGQPWLLRHVYRLTRTK